MRFQRKANGQAYKPGKAPAAKRTRKWLGEISNELIAFGGPNGAYWKRFEIYMNCSFVDNVEFHLDLEVG